MVLKRLLYSGIAVAGLVGLSGCEENENVPITSIQLDTNGLAMVSGDFDGDGDLDIIVGGHKVGTNYSDFYFLENDGKGNFTVRKPRLKAEKEEGYK